MFCFRLNWQLNTLDSSFNFLLNACLCATPQHHHSKAQQFPLYHNNTHVYQITTISLGLVFINCQPVCHLGMVQWKKIKYLSQRPFPQTRNLSHRIFQNIDSLLTSKVCFLTKISFEHCFCDRFRLFQPIITIQLAHLLLNPSPQNTNISLFSFLPCNFLSQ